ncbi:hypothetical protein F5Y03DRAFT_96075 [Xylaria venustula]|nr:hypothetical protein F5Y03DRAFT_96075 [Xylaria venustula]
MLLPYSIHGRVDMHLEKILQALGPLLVHMIEYRNAPLFNSADEEKRQYAKVVTDRDQLCCFMHHTTHSLKCCLAPPKPHGGWGHAHAGRFGRCERERANQTFIIAPNQDLVYITDPRHPEVFLRLWDSRWCEKVQRLALVVCDCRTGAEWLGFDLPSKVQQLWPGAPGLFRETKLKEILLVVRPRQIPKDHAYSDLQELLLLRDRFGFVNYRELRDDASVFTQRDVNVVDSNFTIFQDQLQRMLPEHSRNEVKFSRVVDIDCNSLGMTDYEEAYRNYSREH